nr:hypothetical protein [Tanacetum cinerariifolium]
MYMNISGTRSGAKTDTVRPQVHNGGLGVMAIYESQGADKGVPVNEYLVKTLRPKDEEVLALCMKKVDNPGRNGEKKSPVVKSDVDRSTYWNVSGGKKYVIPQTHKRWDGEIGAENHKRRVAKVLIVGYEHVVMNCGSAGNRYLHSPLMFPAIKQLAIKWWDEYGFVIHPGLVGVTYKSVRIDL